MIQQDKMSALRALQKLEDQLLKIDKIDLQISQINEEIENKKQWVDEPNDERAAAAPPSGQEVAVKQAEEDQKKKIYKVRPWFVAATVLMHLALVGMYWITRRPEDVGFDVITSIVLLVSAFYHAAALDGDKEDNGEFILPDAQKLGCLIGFGIAFFFVFSALRTSLYIVIALSLERILVFFVIRIYKFIEKRTQWDNPKYADLVRNADRRLAEYRAEESTKREARVNEYTVLLKNSKFKIEQLEKEKSVCKEAVLINDCISVQDKNLRTVQALITYLVRGQADTIKEALNLYDAKCERAAHESARWRAQSFYEQQRLNEQRRAMARMAEEQEDHNRRIREAQAKRDEKIDEAIREMKEKLNE